jgi:predicted negative regulator of RcsB-dependent stress response
LAQLRIAGLAMDMQALDVAQDWLNRAYAPEFAGLQQDRLGDLAVLKKDMKKAVQHYTKAKSLLSNDPYLPIVDAKLSAYAVEQP